MFKRVVKYFFCTLLPLVLFALFALFPLIISVYVVTPECFTLKTILIVFAIIGVITLPLSVFISNEVNNKLNK